MTKVVSFLNTKGGVGKSTMVIHLGAYLKKAMPDMVVKVVETDTQQSVSLFADRAQKNSSSMPEVIYHQPNGRGADFRAFIESLEADLVLIDGIGHMDTVLNRTIMASDFIVWVAGNCINDITPLPVAVELAQSLGKPGAYLVNAARPRTKLHSYVMEVLESGDFNGYPRFQNYVRDMMAFKNAYALDTTVVDFGSEGSQAVKDLSAVADELIDFLAAN